MDDLANDSPIGRLLEEISWQSAKKYRNGGRGIEDVLTAEVFLALDLLPRDHFLGEILRRSHGADSARASVVTEVEEARFTLLPDELILGPNATKVQPDGLLKSPSTLVLIESKRIRRSTFQKHQLAREFLALTQKAGDRVPLLLLVLGSPPPVLVETHGRQEPFEAIALTLTDAINDAGFTGLDAAELLERAEHTVAWITWNEIQTTVAEQAAALSHLPNSIAASVQRLASAATRAIDWHA
ncbi:MAG: hypothetical protein KDB38_11960 [Nocardioidaceae bacterium]|nr:hypothetical protein [Nocardioidaceae bacterium]MCB0993394.1 hypothetical protein [Acidimicrobiales bacterium]MCO5325025.1 hypothetical protein [Nocardioidaceae bacterium]